MSFVNIIKCRATCVARNEYGNDDINGCSQVAMFGSTWDDEDGKENALTCSLA